MLRTHLDSRASLGSDIVRESRGASRLAEASTWAGDWSTVRSVRVVLGKLGASYRLSAPVLNVVQEAPTIEEAWKAFLAAVRLRDDAANLTFDVGPTRPDEIDQGLDAPEFEDWAQDIA